MENEDWAIMSLIIIFTLLVLNVVILTSCSASKYNMDCNGSVTTYKIGELK